MTHSDTCLPSACQCCVTGYQFQAYMHEPASATAINAPLLSFPLATVTHLYAAACQANTLRIQLQSTATIWGCTPHHRVISLPGWSHLNTLLDDSFT